MIPLLFQFGVEKARMITARRGCRAGIAALCVFEVLRWGCISEWRKKSCDLDDSLPCFRPDLGECDVQDQLPDFLPEGVLSSWAGQMEKFQQNPYGNVGTFLSI